MAVRYRGRMSNKRPSDACPYETECRGWRLRQPVTQLRTMSLPGVEGAAPYKCEKEIRRTLKIREGDPSLTTLTSIDKFCIAIHSLSQRITAESLRCCTYKLLLIFNIKPIKHTSNCNNNCGKNVKTAKTISVLKIIILISSCYIKGNSQPFQNQD